jgi:hypothetical protein
MPHLYMLQPESDLDSARYGNFVGPTQLVDLPSRLSRGSQSADRPDASDRLHHVTEMIEAVAPQVVNAPIVLWPDRVGRRTAAQMASVARVFGVRATQ